MLEVLLNCIPFFLLRLLETDHVKLSVQTFDTSPYVLIEECDPKEPAACQMFELVAIPLIHFNITTLNM
jgi:hypothetical protein